MLVAGAIDRVGDLEMARWRASASLDLAILSSVSLLEALILSLNRSQYCRAYLVVLATSAVNTFS
jgi:hypothetical protein